MRIATRAHLRALAGALPLALALAAPLAAQHAPSPARAPSLAPEERQRYLGVYRVAAPGAEAEPRRLRVFEYRGALMAQLNDNEPTPLRYLGGDAFRPEQAPGFRVSFTVADGRARRVSIASPADAMAGDRDDAAEDPAASGALFDELARMDRALFDAAYVSCDMARVEALFTDDAEFYHDRSGFQPRERMLAAFRGLTRDCPRERGITRELVPGTLRVYPIHEYGAVQVGAHRFVPREGPSGTAARFVTLWRRVDGEWKASRVLSFDHRAVPRD